MNTTPHVTILNFCILYPVHLITNNTLTLYKAYCLNHTIADKKFSVNKDSTTCLNLMGLGVVQTEQINPLLGQPKHVFFVEVYIVTGGVCSTETYSVTTEVLDLFAG